MDYATYSPDRPIVRPTKANRIILDGVVADIHIASSSRSSSSSSSYPPAPAVVLVVFVVVFVVPLLLLLLLLLLRPIVRVQRRGIPGLLPRRRRVMPAQTRTSTHPIRCD